MVTASTRPRLAAGLLRRAAAALALVALAAPAVGRADAPAEPKAGPRAEDAKGVVLQATPTYDLPRVLELADRNHPSIGQARARLLQVRAQLDEARFAPFSMFKLSGGVTLAPALKGNNVFSPNTDVGLNSGLGVAWRVTLDGVVPLWTFGKITNLWDAAEANVKVNEAGLDKERDAVRLDVRKAYFGYQLAREALALLVDVRKQVKDAETRLDKAIQKDEGDPIDLLKLQTYAAELDAREAEADKYRRVALAALRFYTGVANLEVAQGDLKPPKHALLHVTQYLTAARLYRPEVRMAKHGVEARTALVHLSRAQLFPDIGLAAQIGYSAAPAIANQINPFAFDQGNYFVYGAALVFQWKLDFLPGVARVKQAEAQLEEMRQLERYALGGVGLEVEQAYADVVDWQKRADAYGKAVTTAKKWLVSVQQGIDVGTVEEKDLVDPAKAWALNRFQQLNAVMELDLAMCRLARATGWDAIAPDGA